MKNVTDTTQPNLPRKAPDAILAELWEVKRQINAEADYQVEKVSRMAHEAAEKILKQRTKGT